MGKVHGEEVGFDPVFKEHGNNCFFAELGNQHSRIRALAVSIKGRHASVYMRPLFHILVGLVISCGMAWLLFPSPTSLPLLMPVQWEPGTHWRPCESWLHVHQWTFDVSSCPLMYLQIPQSITKHFCSQSQWREFYDSIAFVCLCRQVASIVKEMFEIKHHYYIPSFWASSLGPLCFWVKAQTRTCWKTFPLTTKEGPFLANGSWRAGAQGLFTVALKWHLTFHCFHAF